MAKPSFEVELTREISKRLPFQINIDDGQRQFDYRFSSLRFNHGSLPDFNIPIYLLSDEQQLLRLHRVGMDSHLFGSADQIKSIFADHMTTVSEGEA